MTISLCMIARDEEAVLGRCMEGVKGLVDEVVILDTGSVDRTKEIAGEYTDKVYDFTWVDDFSAARNAAFGYATGDYAMWLDADDVLEEEDREKFRALRRRMEEEWPDVVMLPYHTGFDEKGRVTFSYYRERIVKNHAGFLWVGPVHEVMVPRGKILYGDCAVTHRKVKPGEPGRNLRILEKARSRGRLDGRQSYYYGRELLAAGRYEEAKEALEEFLDREDGWKENKIDACRQLGQCYQALKQPEKALRALLRSLEYDIPRGEVCCDLGRFFLQREEPETGAYWYLRALEAPRREETGGFVYPDAYGYIPAIELCVCYCRMGDYRAGWAWNERAEMFKPGDAAVAHNRAFLLTRLENLPGEDEA